MSGEPMTTAQLIREADDRLTVGRLGKSMARETDLDLLAIRRLRNALMVLSTWQGGGDVAVRALPDREAAASEVDRLAGWQHLRKCSGMPAEWMDQLRDGIARVVLAGVQGDEKPAGNPARPDREAIARELLWQRYNPETARRAEAALGGWYRSEWLNALREADAVLALFGQEGQA